MINFRLILFIILYASTNIMFGQNDIFFELEKYFKNSSIKLEKIPFVYMGGKAFDYSLQIYKYRIDESDEEYTFSLSEFKTKEKAEENLELIEAYTSVSYDRKDKQFDKGYIYEDSVSYTLKAIYENLQFTVGARSEEEANIFIDKLLKFFETIKKE